MPIQLADGQLQAAVVVACAELSAHRIYFTVKACLGSVPLQH